MRKCFLVRFILCLLLFFSISTSISFAELQTEVTSPNSNKTIIAVVQSNSPPTYFKDPVTGKASGFATDVMNALAKRGGFSVTYQFEKNWDAIAPLLQSGKVNIAPGQGISEDKNKVADFTLPIATFPVSMFVRANNLEITDIKDIKIVGVTKGSASSDIIEMQYPALKIMPYENNASGMMDLLAGHIDAFCTSSTTLIHIATEAGLEDKIRIIGKPLAEIKSAIAVRKDDPELISNLNKHIAEFSLTDEYKEIYSKWYGNAKPYWTVRKVLVFTSIFVLLTLGWMAIWRYRSMAMLNLRLQQNIDNLKQAEGAVSAIQKLLKDITDNSSSLIYALDLQGRFLLINKRLEAVLGVSRELLIGKTREGILQTEIAAKHHDNDVRVMADRQAITFEEENNESDGKHTYLSTKFPLLDAQEVIYGIGGISIDITERKQAQMNIENLADEWQQTFDAIPSSVFLRNVDGVITQCNIATENITGRSRDEIIGRKCWELMHGTNEPIPECPIPAMIISGKRETMLLPIGDTWYQVCVDTIRDKAGNLVGAVHTMDDITERRAAEVELLISKEKFETLFKEAPLGIALIDSLTGHIYAVNSMFAKIAGRTAQEMTKIDLMSIIHPDDVQKDLDNMALLNAGKVSGFQMRKRYIHPDGSTIWLNMTIAPMTVEDKTHPRHICMIQDITEHRKLEEQLRQSQKMESIGTLAGGVAHDFNNILSAIVGYGHLSLMKMPEDDTNRLNIEHILEASEKAAHLTKDLLLFSRKQTLDSKLLELNEILRRLQKFLLRVIGEDIICNAKLSEEKLMISADSHQLEQVIMNLTTNARDAMPTGGTLTITTEEVQLDEEFTSPRGLSMPGRYAHISLSDTGHGMSKETSQKIFEPFFTTKEVGKGTGLGLAVAYGIIKQHEGCIMVYSELGIGTTFSIYLPLIGSAEAEDKEVVAEEQPVVGVEKATEN